MKLPAMTRLMILQSQAAMLAGVTFFAAWSAGGAKKRKTISCPPRFWGGEAIKRTQ